MKDGSYGDEMEPVGLFPIVPCSEIRGVWLRCGCQYIITNNLSFILQGSRFQS